MTDPDILFWLTSFSLLFLLFTSIILTRNRIEFTALRHHRLDTEDFPKISVCIPARNEESNIIRVLTSVCKQNYANFELLVLDDHSTDNTANLISSIQDKYPAITKIVQAKTKPAEWLGKPWACQQLANHATGDIILFLDADTILFPDMLEQTAAAFDEFNLDVITVWPEQVINTFWEKMIIPMIYYSLLTLLPTIYVYRPPRWIPGVLKKSIFPKFAAACGQCIGFKAGAYNKIGGHKAVKTQIVEDVELAKLAKKNGLTIRMFEGVGSISCRMYTSEKEIFNGLRKNLLAGFGRSIPLFSLMAFVHLIVFVFPFIIFPYAIYIANPALLFLSTAAISVILLHRFILALWFRWDPVYGFLHFLSVLWFQRLALVSLVDYFSGRKVQWKERDL